MKIQDFQIPHQRNGKIQQNHIIIEGGSTVTIVPYLVVTAQKLRHTAGGFRFHFQREGTTYKR